MCHLVKSVCWNVEAFKKVTLKTDNIHLWLVIIFRRGSVLLQQAVVLQLQEQLPQLLLHHKQLLIGLRYRGANTPTYPQYNMYQ